MKNPAPDPPPLRRAGEPRPPCTLALALCAASLALATAVSATVPPPNSGADFRFGSFGPVAVYRPASGEPRQVALFVSGDGGWNQGVVSMARHLAEHQALVLGIDIRHYLKASQAREESCFSAAEDLEALSQFAQKKLELARYTPPILLGYSSGATLVYAALAQAPAATFRGAISMGFCPDLPLAKPLCRGEGLSSRPGAKGQGSIFEPRKDLKDSWLVLQGQVDQVCDPATVDRFAAGIAEARVIKLPKVGHGFGVEANWLPQLTAAISSLGPGERDHPPPAAEPESAAQPDVADLPLVEVPAAGKEEGSTLAVMLSGDGGWAGLDKEVAAQLAGRGVPVLGWSSLQYFWTPRTPAGAAEDLGRALRHYLAAWHRERALLIGYSLGADVLPFLVNRLPDELRAKVAGVVLIGPSARASFEFHLGEWLGRRDDGPPVLPEVQALSVSRVLCLYGEGEKDSLCSGLSLANFHSQALPGAHHFGGNYELVAAKVLAMLN